MINVTALETQAEFIFTATDGNYNFEYRFGKEHPENQTLEDYLNSCKRETELLFAFEIEKLQPGTPIDI